jgi:hypothetical protein
MKENDILQEASLKRDMEHISEFSLIYVKFF